MGNNEKKKKFKHYTLACSFFFFLISDYPESEWYRGIRTVKPSVDEGYFISKKEVCYKITTLLSDTVHQNWWLKTETPTQFE